MDTPRESPWAGAATTNPFRVGLVTDVGGLDDSFNRLACVGMERADKTLYIESRVMVPSSSSDYVPHLTLLAEEHFDLVVAVGFRMANALNVVARRFSEAQFAIVDVAQDGLADKPANICGLVFKEEESGYLAGYLAGLVVKGLGGRRIVSAVGGYEIPPVGRYIAGYRAGAMAADPGIEVLVDHSHDAADPAPCKMLALTQIEAGSQVVFQVAGGCGLGALQAAQEQGVWGVGVDADQSYLGPHILTSAVKRVDVAVFKTITMTRSGSLPTSELVFGLAEGGTGVGRTSDEVSPSIVAEVQALERRIATGAIRGIPTALDPA